MILADSGPIAETASGDILWQGAVKNFSKFTGGWGLQLY